MERTFLYSTDWKARVDAAIASYQASGDEVAFIDEMHQVARDRLHWTNTLDEDARLAAMTPEQRNEYWRGYNDDEFLVGRRWR